MLIFKRLQVLTGVACAAALMSITATVPAADDATIPDKVTYTRDIAPIFQANCVVCHRSEDIAPISLRNYDEVRPWAKSIRKAVSDRSMPPWHADPGIGKFSNDRSLSEKDIATIQTWVRQGANRGNPDDMPEPLVFDDAWRLGEPDLVLEFKEVELPAGGPDNFYDLVADVGNTEDKWLRAIEFQPGNRRVVHHIIAFLRAPGDSGQPQGWLGGWAAGMTPMEFPEGTGRMLPKGSKVIADMHYHPLDDEPSKDITRIGLYFADKPAEKEVINLWVQNGGFRIPAGAANHEVKATHTFEQDSTILSFLPHMHYRGKDFTYTATFPDGRQEKLLQVGKYDFNWQTVYLLEEPLKAPKGTRIDCVAHFDNSIDNPDNPDPSKVVTFGNESYDEMMIGFVDYIVDSGVRPPSSAEVIVSKLDAMKTEHPGEAYSAMVWQDATEEREQTALYFPTEGVEGYWWIPINSTPMKGILKNIARVGQDFTAELTIPLAGTLPVKGRFDLEEGTVTGEVDISKMNSPVLHFEATRAK